MKENIMAYQDITPASSILSHEISLTRRGFAAVGTWFAQLGTSMAMASEGQRRVNQVKALEALSDAELARINVKRDEIVRHVFGDLFYL